jgi:hypothetical protein
MLAAGAEISGSANQNVWRGPDLKSAIETLLGNQMPPLVEVGKDAKGNSIYRKIAPDGTPVKTYQENFPKNRLEKFQHNKKAQGLVEISLFKHNAVVFQALQAPELKPNLMERLGVKDIVVLSQIYSVQGKLCAK